MNFICLCYDSTNWVHYLLKRKCDNMSLLKRLFILLYIQHIGTYKILTTASTLLPSYISLSLLNVYLLPPFLHVVFTLKVWLWHSLIALVIQKIWEKERLRERERRKGRGSLNQRKLGTWNEHCHKLLSLLTGRNTSRRSNFSLGYTGECLELL